MQQSGTIIMMLTSGDRPGDVSKCEQLGIASYLLKPIKQSGLFDAIVLALGGTAPEDEDTGRIAAEQASRLRPLRVLLAEGSPRPEPAPSESKTLDWSEALRGVQEDHALLKAIVEAILDEAPRLLTAMRQAITASDTAALRRAAHTLKGSIGHFGETDAFEHACRLEMMGEEGSLGNAEETLAALEREMEWVVQALSEYVQRDGT
jgi:HPt (histidine-containing phosphotransfer) domain-containing protein